MNKNWIAKDDKACMKILLVQDASEQEKYAASELRYYLEMITNCIFELVTEKEDTPTIAVGKAAQTLGIEYDSSLGEDGFSLNIVGDNLAITGGIRGVIYGVYELLERIGCRYFTPTCEKIPSISELELPQFNESQKSPFVCRDHNYIDLKNYAKYAVKNRFNGSFSEISTNIGGHMSYTPGWFVHTFNKMVERDKYFTNHPEYFAEINGVRISQLSQLCLSNKDVLKICIQSVLDALRKNPDTRIISVSQDDNDVDCQCENCRKINEEEGSAAGSILRFVNKVAEAIELEFPNVTVDTLAYQYSRPTPKYVKPRKNVCVRLCSIECCFTHSFEKCDDKSRLIKRPDGTYTGFLKDIQDWGKHAHSLYIWDYTTCFAHYPTPHPNWNVLQPNIKVFADNSVKGVFEQANGALGGGCDFNEMRAYLIGKLLWNPDADIAYHMNDFLSYYYGEAAPYLMKYIQTMLDKVEKENVHVGFNDNPVHGYLTDDMLDIYDVLFDKAQAAACSDGIRLYRVQKARMAIRYVRIKNNAMNKNIHDAKTINDFFVDWKAFGLTRLDEWCNESTTHRALLDNKWRGVEYFNHWEDEGPEFL